jgi:hypothetical protein
VKTARHAREHHQKVIAKPMPFKLTDDEDTCKATYKTESECDTDSKCTWCNSSAVASACHSAEFAQKLPPSIFACDKKNAFELFGSSKRHEQKSSMEASIMPKFDFSRARHGSEHKKHCRFCPVKAFLIATFVAFFYFLKKHQHAMEEYIEKGGKLESKGGCPWRKCKKGKESEAPKKQNPIFEYTLDHEQPVVIAPQPVIQTYRVEKPAQQMV